jgi:hypothetical protein
MPFNTVAIKEAVNFCISINDHKEVILIDIAILPLFAAEIDIFISEYGSMFFRKMTQDVSLVEDRLIVVK